MEIKGNIGARVLVEGTIDKIMIEEGRIQYSIHVDEAGFNFWADEDKIGWPCEAVKAETIKDPEEEVEEPEEGQSEDPDFNGCCSGCRYSTTSFSPFINEKCDDCIGFKNFEPRGCGNCKSFEKSEDELPCVNCNNKNHWEPMKHEEEEPVEDPVGEVKRGRGRPKKATVEDLMKKCEQIKIQREFKEGGADD